MSEQKTCRKSVPSGPYTSLPCGRPVKGDGELCGIHAAAKKRREANDAKRSIKFEQWRADMDRGRELEKDLKALGVDTRSTENGLLLTLDGAAALVDFIRKAKAENH